MDEQNPDSDSPGQSSANERTSAEPVRSRWTPKPEQILILESIFNSGMVNPPKDETVRIRKLLEKFGTVGDANVFYWFQNRRSRSRRRQRQLQAGLVAGMHETGGTSGAAMYEPSVSSSSSASSSSSSWGGLYPSTSTASSSSSSSFIGDESADDLFSISRQMGFTNNSQAPFLCSPDFSYLQYQPGPITVFINGIPSEIPSGPIDTRALFGPDVMLVHSSGELVPVNEYGILMQGLQMGESYFLVSRPT